MAASRRTVLGVVGTGVAVAAAAAAWRYTRPRPSDPAWLAYRTRFYVPEGRIVDTGNNGVSHSEGQGYGMLFAVHFDDRAAFDQLWQWTRKTLARADGLHAWRYVPGGTPPVADQNNASDGDLLMAWALLRAGRKWGGSYGAEGRALAEALKAAVVEADGKTYLLPGLAGFTSENSRIVNLSYWVFPALRAVADETGDGQWTRVLETGVALIDAAKFESRQLPPDWLETIDTLRPAEKFPARFGYDAVRVPLNLTWAKLGTPARLGAIAQAWGSFTDGAPAWISLTDDSVSPEKQSAGMRAVAALTTAAANAVPLTSVGLPAMDAATDYYAASLLMQCRLCFDDTATNHVS